MKIKGKVYRTVVRPALMYGAESWALKKAQEKKLEVAEMRMLRWMQSQIQDFPKEGARFRVKCQPCRRDSLGGGGGGGGSSRILP